MGIGKSEIIGILFEFAVVVLYLLLLFAAAFIMMG
jgi:hypothetical protein